jgi:acyl-CoA synthetase (AMP-forming)/AMP-acid ligase II
MDLLARHAQARPDTPAVIEGERRLSWREYHEARNRLAHALADLGLAAGEHVVLYAHNALEVLLTSAATRAVGAIPVPMNHRLTDDEVAYILDNSDAVAAATSPTTRRRERSPSTPTFRATPPASWSSASSASRTGRARPLVSSARPAGRRPATGTPCRGSGRPAA